MESQESPSSFHTSTRILLYNIHDFIKEIKKSLLSLLRKLKLACTDLEVHFAWHGVP